MERKAERGGREGRERSQSRHYGYTTNQVVTAIEPSVPSFHYILRLLTIM